MEVLMVTQEFARSRYWNDVIPELVSLGVTPTLVSILPEGPIHEDLRERGVRTVALGATRKGGWHRAYRRLRTLIVGNAYNLVHSHEIVPSIFGGAAGRSRPGVPRIYHRHHASTRRPFAGRASRAAATLNDLTFAVSSAAALAAERVDKTPPDRIVVCHNGVAPFRSVTTDEARSLRSQLGIDATHKVVATISRLRREKGHRTLLDAIDRSPDRIRTSTHVVIVGDGPDGSALRRYARSLPFVRTHFVGHMDSVSEWYQLADVVVVPSDRESFGLSAVEALACRRPVVASTAEGLTEVITHDRTGLLFPPGDHVALAAGLTRVLEDEGLAERLAAEGNARYREMFTATKMASCWVDCYHRILDDAER